MSKIVRVNTSLGMFDFTNIEDVQSVTDGNIFRLKATDGKSDVIFPREVVAYLHMSTVEDKDTETEEVVNES